MTILKSKIDQIVSEHGVFVNEAEAAAEEKVSTEKEIAVLEKAVIVMQKAAALSQQHLAEHLSTIVTQAVQSVIQKPYEFVCEFVERRGSTEADLYLTKGGYRYEILGSTGGGLGDVVSFALKIAYILLSNVDRVLIIDEMIRHLNSPEQRKNFAAVAKRLCEEFGFQLIVNTTIPELIEVADKVFSLTLGSNEETQVEVL